MGHVQYVQQPEDYQVTLSLSKGSLDQDLYIWRKNGQVWESWGLIHKVQHIDLFYKFYAEYLQLCMSFLYIHVVNVHAKPENIVHMISNIFCNLFHHVQQQGVHTMLRSRQTMGSVRIIISHLRGRHV